METYSAPMEASVRQQLQAASPQQLRDLATYYRQRGGPGLELLRTEFLRRGWPDPLPSTPTGPCGHPTNAKATN